MKIRAITLFSPLSWPFDMTSLTSAGRFLQAAKAEFEAEGYEVQTVRLATPPFMDLIGDPDPARLLDFVHQLETHANNNGIGYVSIGPVMAATPRSLLSPIQIVPQLIADTDIIFASAQVCSAETGINLAAIEATAQSIYTIGQNTPNGFGNLRFAMLANVPPRGPFFPGSYHDSSHPAFGIATEAADLALEAFSEAQTLEQAQTKLIANLNHHSGRLLKVIDNLVDNHSLHFTGIDFSLAPFPSDDVSVAGAMERLGLSAFGAHGTVFATAFITNCIKQAQIPHVGYRGVMLPVLEDSILAQRASEDGFTVNDLLLYSAVCGTGLDTIPLPGDTSPEQIAGLLLDVATLALRLDKPLTARLLPVPGLKAGDMTDFDFEYFENSRVLALKPGNASEIFNKGIFIPAQ